MSKEIKYKDVVPNSIVARYKEVRQQYEQEPVGIVRIIGGYPDNSERVVDWVRPYKYLKDGDRLYLAPPKREPLSDEEVRAKYRDIALDNLLYVPSYYAGFRDAERAHGIGVDDEN